MVAKDLIDSVIALPPVDRLELIDLLRESLLNDLTLMPFSDEHRRILDQRLDEFEQDPEGGSPWEEVEARIRAKLRQL